jgi:hypothetical protein
MFFNVATAKTKLGPNVCAGTPKPAKGPTNLPCEFVTESKNKKVYELQNSFIFLLKNLVIT